MTDQRRNEVETLLGRVTMSALRRRGRDRSASASASDAPAKPRLIPAAKKTWSRAARHPVGLVFLALGTATTFSLVFAATRLADDGDLSAADWFRLTIVAIIAVAFLARVLSVVGRLPPIQVVRRALARPATLRSMATIPSVRDDEIGSFSADFGRLSTAERSRIRTQTALDDAFWVSVNVALLGFGGWALFSLGSSAISDIAKGDADTWSYVRVVLAAAAATGLARLLRASIGQLRLRRQRRRKRATRRLLRYLLWWDSPAPVVASGSRFGHTGAALVGLAPFLIPCCIAASAAAYSPWGETSGASESGSAAIEVAASEVAVSQEDRTGDDTDDVATVLGVEPTTSTPDAEPPATSSSLATPESDPTTTPPPPPTTTSAASTSTVPTTTAAATTTSTAVTTTTDAPTTTTTATTTTTTTTTTTAAPTTTTAAPTTTTTQPPAPLMVVHSLNHVFSCNGGTTEWVVSWSVSGDGGGNVNVFRLRSDGFFEQIGFNTGFVANLTDRPPGTGSYQYWLIASNSDNVQTVVKDGFFNSQGTCID